MRRLILMLLCCLSLCADKPSAPAGYSNNFEKTPPGKPPEELMILNGVFSVREEAGNKFLELNGEPLDSCGLLFGAETIVGDASARIWGAATGRRFPELGIGMNDAGGYKLWVLPTRNVIELRKGEETRATASFAWKSGTWTHLRLRVGKTPAGKWKIEGHAWAEGSPEPKDWPVSAEDSDAPPAGRASAWGTPFSGQPIRFDDLTLTPG